MKTFCASIFLISLLLSLGLFGFQSLPQYNSFITNVSAQEVDAPNDDDDVEAEENTEEEIEEDTEEEIEEEKEEVEDETEEEVKDIESDIESAIDEDLEAIEDDSFSQDSVRNALNDGDDQSEDLVAEPFANEEPESEDLDRSLSAAFENFDPLTIDEATGSFVYDPDDDFARSGGIENFVIDPVRPQTSAPGGVGASPDDFAVYIDRVFIQDAVLEVLLFEALDGGIIFGDRLLDEDARDSDNDDDDVPPLLSGQDVSINDIFNTRFSLEDTRLDVSPSISIPGGVGASPGEIDELIAALIQDTGGITEDTVAATIAAGVVADGQSQLILDSLTKQVGASPGGLQGTNPISDTIGRGVVKDLLGGEDIYPWCCVDIIDLFDVDIPQLPPGSSPGDN